MTGLLENEVAVARAFAREGSRVFIAGRTSSKLEEVAAEIRSNGGEADTAVVDALDERAVDEFTDGVASQPGLGGFKVALDAIEGLRRQWSCELGQHGIRFVTLKTGGVPESIPDNFPAKEEIAEGIRKDTLLNRAATLADVGDIAAFVASDLARTLNTTFVNISSGALMD